MRYFFSMLLAFVTCIMCLAQGLSADTNVALQRMIDNAYHAGKKSVVIPPGTYRITAEAGPDKTHCFVFTDMHDFRIDAKDVTFVNTSRARGTIQFLNCSKITLSGLTIRHEVPQASQGTLIQIAPDRKSLDVQVAAGYPADIDDRRYFASVPVIDYYEPNKDLLKDNAPDSSIASIERIGPAQFRFHLSAALPAGCSVEIGDRAAWRGTVTADIYLYKTGGMKIEGVTIESSPGFCVQEEAGDGGNYYNYTLTYGPIPAGATEKPLISSNADAFNSCALRKGPTLWNCLLEGMNDDGVPIHSNYALVGGSSGNVAYLDMRSLPSHFDEFRVGDHVLFYDNLKSSGGEATITAIEPATDYPAQDLHDMEEHCFSAQGHQLWYKLTLDHPVPAQRGWLACDADVADSGYLVHGCTVRNSRGRGMLVNAGNGVIENCTLEHIVYGGIVVAPESSYFTQADYGRNVIIRNNTIRDTSIVTPSSFGGAALSVTASLRGAPVALPGGHRNITITGNTFEDNRAVNILITSAQDVTIKDNRFVRPLAAPSAGQTGSKAPPSSLIWLYQASGVRLQGNTVSDPGAELKNLVQADSSVTATGVTDGVTRK